MVACLGIGMMDGAMEGAIKGSIYRESMKLVVRKALTLR